MQSDNLAPAGSVPSWADPLRPAETDDDRLIAQIIGPGPHTPPRDPGMCPLCGYPVGDLSGHVAIAHPSKDYQEGWAWGWMQASREAERVWRVPAYWLPVAALLGAVVALVAVGVRP